MSASIAICLPGSASSVNRAVTSAASHRSVTHYQKLNGRKSQKDFETNDVIPPNYELPEGFDHAPRRMSSFMSWSKIRLLEAMFSDSRNRVSKEEQQRREDAEIKRPYEPELRVRSR